MDKKNARPVKESSLISQNVKQLPLGDTTTIEKCKALKLRHRTPDVITVKKLSCKETSHLK